MSLSKRTIPYAFVDESRDRPFTDDLKLASLYVLAEARRGTESLSAMAFVNYPFQLRRCEGGVLLLDMLGLTQTTFKFNLIPDVEGFTKILDAVSENPDAFLKELRGRADYFKAFSGKRTVSMMGLVSRSGKIDEVQDLLEKTVEVNQGNESTVFVPVLKEKDAEAIFNSLSSLRKDIAEDEKNLKEAKKFLMDALGIAKKVLKEETQNTKDASTKVKTRMKRDLKKKRDSLKKRLDRDIAKLREASRKQARPLRDERTKLKRRLTRLKKRMERLKGDPKAVEIQKPALDDVGARFRKMDDAVKELEARLKGKVQEARTQFKATLEVEEDKIKAEVERAKAEVQERLDLGSLLEDEAKGIARQIDTLIRRKRDRLRSLSRFCLDLEVEDMELHIPFYVFQYGEKRFDFHPPVMVAGSGGLLSRFRRMLADNVESKVNMLIRPQGAFTERYLRKVVRSLGSKTALAQVYMQEAENLNLLRSLGTIDRIMRGLVKLRREGWISDSEYIQLQETIIDQLSMISRA